MKYFKKKNIIITALIFFTACLISGGLVYLNIKKDNPSALAAPICGDNNIAGFAWSDNIGWISFNSGDCDKNSNTFIDDISYVSGFTTDTESSSIFYTSATVLTNNGNVLVAYGDNGNSNFGTYAVYDLSGNEIKTPTVFEFATTVNISTAFLGNNKVLIAYRDGGNSNYGTFVIYDSTTNNVGAPVVFESVATNGISVTTLNNGNVLIAYESNNIGRFKVFNSSGTLVLGPINFELSGVPIDSSAVTLNNGNVLIPYGKNSGGYFVIYNPSDGSNVRGPEKFDTLIDSQVENISAAALTGGNVSIAYWSSGPDYSYFITLDENGDSVHTRVQLDGQYTFITPQATTALEDDKVFIPYVDGAGDNIYVIYDSLGNQIASPTAFAENVGESILLINGNVFVINENILGGFTIMGEVNCGGNDDASTPVIPYGVKLDQPTGNFSGYAWSSNIGWVSFQENTTPPDSYAFNSNCQETCNASNNCSACKSADGNIYGWAKALSLGDDGWIKLSDAFSWNNGTKINGTTKEFEGWAWNGNTTAGTGIGWLSFSHLNCDTDGDGIIEAGEGNSGCPAAGTAIADYKVYITNTTPTATYLSAPNITYTNACDWRDARRVQLKWQFSDPDVIACGDYQSAYQVIVDSDDHTSAVLESMATNTTRSLPFKTDKLSGLADSIYPTIDDALGRYIDVDLNYDEHYYWWVKVWDKYGADSGWVQFATTTPDTDNDDTGQAGCNPNCDKTFWTYKHEFPKPYFNWFPLEPSEGENISFWDGSYYYTPTEPNTNHQQCFINDIEYCSAFDWTGSNPATQILAADKASTTIIFDPAKISQDITLQATDPDNYYCSTSTSFWAKVKLPTWKEVKY